MGEDHGRREEFGSRIPRCKGSDMYRKYGLELERPYPAQIKNCKMAAYKPEWRSCRPAGRESEEPIYRIIYRQQNCKEGRGATLFKLLKEARASECPQG